MKRKNKRKYKGGDEEEVIKDKIGKVNHKKKRGKRWKKCERNFFEFSKLLYRATVSRMNKGII